MNKQTTATQSKTMKELLESGNWDMKIHRASEVIKGRVIDVSQNKVWMDIGGKSLGVIPKRELLEEKGLKDIEINEELVTYVLAPENDHGYAVLSLKRAIREQAWEELKEKHEKEENVKVRVVEANKGGLLVDIHGVRGFLPVSQLKPEHYPRVDGGNKEEIRERLSKFVGDDLQVRIIAFERASNKLIMSEKAVPDAKQKEIENKYQIGDTVEGIISGIVDFGAFMKFDGVEGLIHISEITWGRVDSIDDHLQVGDQSKAMLIGLDNGRISLSLKRLTPDPWVQMMQKYSIGDIVNGEISKITPFGAFATIDNKIDGLVHISELSEKRVVNPAEIVKVGEKHKFKIISIEADSHRLGLSLKAVNAPEPTENDNKKDNKDSKGIEPESKDKNEAKEEKIEKVENEEAPAKEETPKEAKENKEDKSDDTGLASIIGVSAKISENLIKAGYKSADDLKKLTKEELIAVEGVGDKTADKIIEGLK